MNWNRFKCLLTIHDWQHLKIYTATLVAYSCKRCGHRVLVHHHIGNMQERLTPELEEEMDKFYSYKIFSQ